MPRLKHEPPRGVLNQAEGNDYFQLSRYHPSVQLVFERERTQIWGVVTGKFTRKLEGSGKVLGVKFRPGGFLPFYGKALSNFQNDQLPFSEVFDEDLSLRLRMIS